MLLSVTRTVHSNRICCALQHSCPSLNSQSGCGVNRRKKDISRKIVSGFTMAPYLELEILLSFSHRQIISRRWGRNVSVQWWINTCFFSMSDLKMFVQFTHFLTNGYIFGLILFALLSNSALAAALFVKARKNTMNTTVRDYIFRHQRLTFRAQPDQWLKKASPRLRSLNFYRISFM